MSGMMLHGLGDCTPERNCGCIGKPQDELRERIARAIHANDYVRGLCDLGWGASHVNREAYRANARAVIEALGLEPAVERYGAQESDGTVYGWEPDVETVRREWPGMPVMRCRSYVTPWERIEEDG